jgi:hypothetical protein
LYDYKDYGDCSTLLGLQGASIAYTDRDTEIKTFSYGLSMIKDGPSKVFIKE